MTDERCEFTELRIDECSCAAHGGAPNVPKRFEKEHPPPVYDGPRPPKDAILVHKGGKAHWYGCDRLPDYAYLVPPTWGWIDDKARWQSIGTHEVSATGGNTGLVAQVRCLDCG